MHEEARLLFAPSDPFYRGWHQNSDPNRGYTRVVLACGVAVTRPIRWRHSVFRRICTFSAAPGDQSGRGPQKYLASGRRHSYYWYGGTLLPSLLVRRGSWLPHGCSGTVHQTYTWDGLFCGQGSDLTWWDRRWRFSKCPVHAITSTSLLFSSYLKFLGT